jgi:hypothetical protein
MTVSRHVVLQRWEEKAYQYEIGERSGEYFRGSALFGDLDCNDSFFGGRLAFVLTKKDAAYATIAKSEPGTRGTLTVDVINYFVQSGAGMPPRNETELRFVKFEAEKKKGA